MLKRLLALLILFALVSVAAQPSGAAAQASDPAVVVQALDAALNAHDLEAALALFADGAVVKDGDPAPGSTGNFVGKEQIRAWLAGVVNPALAFRVASSGHQVSGDVVTWVWQASVADFKPLGVDPEPGSSAALVQNGKIIFYSVASSAEWRAKLFAATSAPAALPKTGDPRTNGLGWLAALAGAGLVGAGALQLRRLKQR